jgi:DNA-binding transcriptional ArsR family regulator
MTASVTVEDDEGHPQTSDAPTRRSDSTTVTESPAPDKGDQLPKDVVFGLLSNERRRQVLKYLNKETESASLSDLAEHIASIENDKPVAALSSGERKRVYICLYQAHLPKMDDANVIDYNQARGTVELRPKADQLFRYLAVDPDGTDRPDAWLHRILPGRVRAFGARLLR